MQFSLKRIVTLTILVLLSLVIGISWSQAEEQRDMQGWGIDDPYNKLYDVREFEKIRGWVVRVKEIVPMPGMSPEGPLKPQKKGVQVSVTCYRDTGWTCPN